MIILNVNENKAYNMDNFISIGVNDVELNCKVVGSAEKVVLAKFSSERLAIETLKDILKEYSLGKESVYCIRNVD